MRASRRFGLLFGLTLALGSYACGGDDAKDSTGSQGGTGMDGGVDDSDETGELELVFTPMYSGWDGVHTYKIPVVAKGLKNVKFTASDPSMVDIQKTAEGAMITTRKAGKVTITGTAGGLKGTSELTITQYDPADWEAGKKRYTMGKPFDFPDFDPCNPRPPQIANDLSCTVCHGVGGDYGDIEHTPQQIGGYTDEQMVDIIASAKKPAGAGMHTRIPAFAWKFFHKWVATDQEKKGLIAYIRSLEPETQGELDFGGIVGFDGGFMPPVCDGGVPRSDAGL